MRTAAITKMVNKMVHDNVMTGKAQRKVRGFAVRGVGGRGTLSSFMNDSVYVLSTMMMSSTSTALRAGWAIALALVALWIIDRLKPATPRKTIPVRVDQKPSPLYQEPERQQRRNALLRLSGGAVLTGAFVACIIGFFAAIALELLGGLLGN
jgi:hypothetical protein